MGYSRRPGRPGKPGGRPQGRPRRPEDRPREGDRPRRPGSAPQSRSRRHQEGAHEESRSRRPEDRPREGDRPRRPGDAPQGRSRRPQEGPRQESRSRGPREGARDEGRPRRPDGAPQARSRGPRKERREEWSTRGPREQGREADRPRRTSAPPRDRSRQDREEPREESRPPRSERAPQSRSRRQEGPAVGRPRPRRQEERPRKPASKGRGKPSLEVRWLNLQPFFDFWGNRIQRYFSLNSLTRATEGLLHGNDRFIVPSIQQVLGPAPLTSLTFELFQEGQFQLIFQVRAVNARRKAGVFALVVAKRPGDFSKLAAAEHENLRILHDRAPDQVVRPFRGGRLILFDKRLGEGPKEVYAYLTQWMLPFHELGVARNLQFYVNVKNPQYFNANQTEDIKSQIIEIIARSFDSESRICMEMPQIASGDFVVTAPTQARPRIKLIACRRFLKNMTPVKVIHRILEAHWDWGGRDFRLAPERPETLLNGLTRALGKDTARAWLAEYHAQLASGTFAELPPLTRDAFRELGIG